MFERGGKLSCTVLMAGLACAGTALAQPDEEALAAFNSVYAEFEAAMDSGEAGRAIAASAAALEAGIGAFGPEHATTGDLYTNRALLLEQSGSADLARTAYRRAEAAYTAAIGEDAPQLIAVLLGQARVAQSPAGIADLGLRALQIHETQSPDNALGYADLAIDVGEAISWRFPGGVAGLVPALERALGILERAHGEESTELVPALTALADLSARPYAPEAQIRYYERALDIVERAQGDESMAYGELSLRAGRAITMLSSSPLGNAYVRGAYKLFEDTLEPSHPTRAQAALAMGEYSVIAGNHRPATRYLEEALAHYAGEPGQRNLLLRIHTLLAVSHEKLGRSQDATAHLLAIGELAPPAPDADLQPVFRMQPAYPPGMAAAGEEATVTVVFEVDETGTVRNAAIDSLEGDRAFVEPALEAAARFRYAPRYEKGVPVATTGVKNRFEFVMQ